MGDEADADWEAGGYEQGYEAVNRWFDERITEAMMGGPRPKRRQTALRVRGRSFETVELGDDGKVIEPVRCTCAGMIMHRPKCPFFNLVS